MPFFILNFPTFAALWPKISKKRQKEYTKRRQNIKPRKH